MDQCFDHPVVAHEHETQGTGKWNKLSPIKTPKPADDSTAADECGGCGFDCSICLDSVNDPVVTFCGHLFCWPCIYEWIHVQTFSPEKSKLQPQCPVCKSEVSEKTLIPLYGGALSKVAPNGKSVSPCPAIPQRPASPSCGQIHQQLNRRGHQNQMETSDNDQYGAPFSDSHLGTTSVLHSSSVIPMFGEMMYARIFGNQTDTSYGYGDSYHLSGLGSPRVRRRVVQMDRSLSRVSFFLLCFVIFCLLVF